MYIKHDNYHTGKKAQYNPAAVLPGFFTLFPVLKDQVLLYVSWKPDSLLATSLHYTSKSLVDISISSICCIQCVLIWPERVCSVCLNPHTLPGNST